MTEGGSPLSSSGDVESTPSVRRVEVRNPPGLHARPASVLAAKAQEFDSDITLILAENATGGGIEVGTRVDAKSVLDVIVLGAAQGSKIDIEAVGPDAETAVASLATLFDDQFGME